MSAKKKEGESDLYFFQEFSLVFVSLFICLVIATIKISSRVTIETKNCN